MNFKTIPFNKTQLSEITRQLETLKPEQILWLSGYLEGRLSQAASNGSAVETATAVQSNSGVRTNLTILYGTDTGRAKMLAESLLEKTKTQNINANLLSMYDFNPKKIGDVKNLAVIVSTHGEGDPPDMAEDFYLFITGKRAPKLPDLNYSVLALGDKSYRQFCKTGTDIDAAFQKLGATTISPVVKCDVDFEQDASDWMDNFLQNLPGAVVPAQQANMHTGPAATTLNGNGYAAVPVYSKKNPFPATVLEKVKITGRDSDKEVYHLELSLEGSGLSYEPGDAVGIFFKNPDTLVQLIIEKSGADPNTSVNLKNGNFPFTEALSALLEISVLSLETLQKYFEKTANPQLSKILNDDKFLDEYLWGHDILDLLEDFPYNWKAQDLTDILRPLPPRLYSISSSRENVGEEVHLTVSVVRYDKKNRKRNGACSSYLACNLEVDSKVMVYIEKNPLFKLPANGSKIIMVGAGTGIAPYRAFMQHRESLGIKGNSWLFFGDRRFQSDFLYQVEWQNLLKSKSLEKMEVAFSRDQKEKVYVQHKLIENKREIFEWIENGAVIYLCGDRRSLAKDVNQTLLEIIRTQGGISEEQAQIYLKNLKKEKRFQIDVY